MNIYKKIIAIIAAFTMLEGCHNAKKSAFHEDGAKNDCSAMFETRYLDSDKNISYKKDTKMSAMAMDRDGQMMSDNEENKMATECKVLEVKIDKNTKCEIVGSDKIDNLSKVLNENKANRTILITPRDKIDDLNVLSQKYLISKGIDIKKHIDSEIFNNLNFPYKGMRCQYEDKEFVLWVGDKKVVLSIGNL